MQAVWHLQPEPEPSVQPEQPKVPASSLPCTSSSWGPPQGWAHLLPQDYNGNLPPYIRSKLRGLYNSQEPYGETGRKKEEVYQLIERRAGASNWQNKGPPPSSRFQYKFNCCAELITTDICFRRMSFSTTPWKKTLQCWTSILGFQLYRVISQDRAHVLIPLHFRYRKKSSFEA